MTGLKVLQPEFAGGVGLSDRKVYETAVVGVIRGPAVNEMCSGDRLRGDSVKHAASRAVHFRTLAGRKSIRAQQRHQQQCRPDNE